MSTPLILLLLITFLYAGYNLLIKVSSSYVPLEASSTILADDCPANCRTPGIVPVRCRIDGARSHRSRPPLICLFVGRTGGVVYRHC